MQPFSTRGEEPTLASACEGCGTFVKLWLEGQRRDNGEATHDDYINTLGLGPGSSNRKSSQLLGFDRDKASACYIRHDHKASPLGILWCWIDESLASRHLLFWLVIPIHFFFKTLHLNLTEGSIPSWFSAPVIWKGFSSHFLQGWAFADPALGSEF